MSVLWLPEHRLSTENTLIVYSLMIIALSGFCTFMFHLAFSIR